MNHNTQNNLNWRQHQKEIAANLVQFYQKPVMRISLELVLSIGLVVFLIVVVIQPTMATMTRLTKEINERAEIDKQLPKKIAALSSAQAEYMQVADELPLLDEAIPEKINIIKYLKIIEYEASHNNVVIMGLTANQQDHNDKKKNTTNQTEKTINISVSISGGYSDIKSFIKSLENSRATFLINSVSFNVKKKKKNNFLTASISISIPYYQAKTKTYHENKSI